MIVVDTSALVAIALDEPSADACIAALEDAEQVLISAGTLTETLILSHGRQVVAEMTAIFDQFGMEVVALTDARARAAAQAYRRYGKGWHAAALNYGDSFAYALAREFGCPLLFVGNDFALTDVEAVL